MKSILTILFFAVFCFRLQAQPGTLDHSFGDSGKVVAATYEGNVYTSLLQPDGKIVVAGSGGFYKQGVPIGGALLVRYNSDGSLDYTFGDSGRVISNIGESSVKAIRALALQSNGKIVALVRGYSAMALIRINSNGSTDESFGKVGLALGPTDDGYIPTDMAILPDGRIVITGDVRYEINDDNRCFVTCFLSSGALDETFGENATVKLELNSPLDITSVAVTKSGKIIIGGNYNFLNKTLLLGFNGDGTHNESFGKNGLAEMSFDRSITDPALTDLAIADDNKFVASGWCYFNSRAEVALANRFLPNGLPDSTFGGAGYATAKSGEGDLHANSVAVQQDGRVVLGGFLDISNTVFKFAVVRIDGDGGVDSTYGTNGIGLTEFSGGDQAYSLLLQKDGKAVLTGNTFNFEFEQYVPALARYNGDLTQRQRIITRIKRWMQHHGITWQGDNNVRYYNVQRSTDGGITYQPIAKLYNHYQPRYNYEEATITNNALYRVAAVGKDGSRTYSNSVLISNETSVKVFPNPVRGSMQLQGLPSAGKTNISVSDFSGTVRTSAVVSGSNYSINTSNLKPGSYLLKIHHDNTVTTQTFVKE